jgi:type I restriction enzyme R subunit
VETSSNNEAFSRVLIDRALDSSGWDLLDEKQVRFEFSNAAGRADYLLRDSLGRVICVLEAKRQDIDPYDAKEQARGYANNLGAPFIILSNGVQHWFWNLESTSSEDAYQIERLPSRVDLERMRLRNLQPPRALSATPVDSGYLKDVRPDLELRGYQVDALRAIADGFDNEHRRSFLLEMATGTGKTLLCAALIRRFLTTRNAERVLFIVDRIELARQTMEDFNVVLSDYKPVIYKTARRNGDLLGSSVVIATIQSLMVDRRYRTEFSPFYFDLVINDEAHRSIYGDSREAVQFFQATRVGLTATPKAYLRNADVAELSVSDPKALEARELMDTYRYFGCEPGNPSFRYDMLDAIRDPEGPFLCPPRIIDCRSDITTHALQDAGWTVQVDEREESFKVRDLERKIFTPHRNQVMCETFLEQAQLDPTGTLGKTIIFAVNQNHATAITKILNHIRPGVAVTITSRVAVAAQTAKEFRDGNRSERVAVSVDMLSTGYNCPDLLNVVLMRPVFSPSEYLQIKGRGTRRFVFHVDGSDYEKRNYFLLDFCAVAEYFEEQYDYSAPLKAPRLRVRGSKSSSESGREFNEHEIASGEGMEHPKREIPVWEGIDKLVSAEVRIVGPDGEKVDSMTFRGSFERDIRQFAENDTFFLDAIDAEDDDEVESIMQQRFYHLPRMYYAPEKLVASYGVPAPTPAFAYAALGRRELPTRDAILSDTVASISSRFELRYMNQKWLRTTAELVVEDSKALREFVGKKYNTLFSRSQFRTIGGMDALTKFEKRDEVFDALLSSSLIEATRSALVVEEGSSR